MGRPETCSKQKSSQCSVIHAWSGASSEFIFHFVLFYFVVVVIVVFIMR